MNSTPSTPLNLVSTDQIQKYLEENKNLIMAILESQQKGKVAECAQYQANLQKNLMYLAAIADAQPQESAPDTQLPASSAAPRGNSQSQSQPQPQMPHAQASPVQPQPGGPMAKLPFQLNALRPQDQQNNPLLLQFLQQRQMQGSQGGNNGMHLMMQPGVGNSGNPRDMKGSQPTGLSDAGGGSGDGQRNSGLGPMQGGR